MNTPVSVHTRPHWVAFFAAELCELRPDIPFKFAQTVGHAEWGYNPNRVPEVAAKESVEARKQT